MASQATPTDRTDDCLHTVCIILYSGSERNSFAISVEGDGFDYFEMLFKAQLLQEKSPQ